MSSSWRRIGRIAPGGTVIDMASDASGNLYAVTGAGILQYGGDGWRSLRGEQPMPQVTALACDGDILLAGGGLGEIVYSHDGGDTWSEARTPYQPEAVTCISISPTFQADGVALAGTDGAGAMRCTDGGRNWQFGSVGLEDSSLTALTVAAGGQDRGVAFAGTSSGLYRSPNSGRAWKKVRGEPDSVAIQAVAAGAGVEPASLVLVGTEVGLLRSTDGCRTWSQVGWESGMGHDFPPVNCIWVHHSGVAPPVFLAGTGDGRIFRSADGGANWTHALTAGAAVMCLGGEGGLAYAGLYKGGALVSRDAGLSWEEDVALAARGITRLERLGGEGLIAYGPLEGAWRSEDRGRTWEQVLASGVGRALYVASAPPASDMRYVLAGTEVGLLRSTDGGLSWQAVLEDVQVVSIAFSPRFADDGRVWACSLDGRLLTSRDHGSSWLPHKVPNPGVRVVSIATPVPSSTLAAVDVLAAATYDGARRLMELWRSSDGEQGWERWLEQEHDRQIIHLSLSTSGAEGSVACIGGKCWCFTSDGWILALESESPIRRLTRSSDRRTVIILTQQEIFESLDGLTWDRRHAPHSEHSLTDLSVFPHGQSHVELVGASMGGATWSAQV